MGAPGMHQIRGRWEGFTLGTWREGDDCASTLMETVTVVYADGSWVRTGHDPEDPLRSWHESSEDADAQETGEELMARYRSYVHLGVPVSKAR